MIRFGGSGAAQAKQSPVEARPRAHIHYVKLTGTIDQAFDGGRLAAKARGKTLVIDLGEVKRISSSGLRGWMDLVTTHEPTYLVECSAHVISQFNVMAGLAGKAKVVSFYAPYRCAPCSSEFDVLFVMPRDRVVVRGMAPSQHACPKCGTLADLDDEPTSFFAAVSKQAVFDLDEDVTGFLRSKLKYDVTLDASQLRVHQFVQGRNSYIRMSGNIDRGFPVAAVAAAFTGPMALDLEGASLIDSSGIAQLRTLLRQVRTSAASLVLIDCPSVYLERVLLPEDLEKWVTIYSLVVTYECGQCQQSLIKNLDVAKHLGPLRTAAMPPVECATCHVPMIPNVPEGLSTMLRRLPKPELDPARERFIKKAKKLPLRKLQNVLSPRPLKNPVPFLVRLSFVTMALAIAILATVAVIAQRVYKHQQTGGTAVVVQNAQDAAPRYERPTWIIGSSGGAYCHDLINRFMCVGNSEYGANRDDALVEATNAALDELANSIGLKIDDPRFRDLSLMAYQGERSKALAALDADLDPASAEFQAAHERVDDARARVARAIRMSGGTAVPAQRTDWYWEEYEADQGGSEYLVFVRFDVSLDAIKALVSRYTLPVDVMGSSAVSAFPALAWGTPGFDGGVMVLQPRGDLAKAGLQAGQIITSINGERIDDPAVLSQRLKQVRKSGKVTLKILRVTGSTTSLELAPE